MKQMKKWICLLLALSLILPAMPVTAVHAHGTDHAHDEEVHYVNPPAFTNPMYRNGEQSVATPEPVEGITTNVSEDDYLTDVDDAIVQLRNAIRNREPGVTIYFKRPASSSPGADYNELYEKLIQGAFAHTGVPTEGDYIYLQFARISAPGQYYGGNGYTYFTMNFQLAYYTSREQEERMNVEVPKLLNKLNLGGKSDYEKVKGVYDWLCQNVKYDYTNLNNPSHTLKYSAYAALVNKTAVCQGYAVLFYRLLLELGVDCRAIGGYGNGGPHSWNLVKLGGKYYNLDATWDAEHYSTFHEYEYFLRTDNTFGDHQRDPMYTTSEFYNQYPMGTTDYRPGGAIPVTGVSLTPAEVSVLVGESVVLTAVIAPSNATNQSVFYDSSDPAIATVDEYSGVVTGVKPGTVTITVITNDGGFADASTVVVNCDHIFNDQIEDPAYLVPETANNCNTMKEYYYLCSICGAVGTNRWIGSQRGDHVIDEDAWESAGEIGHWHPCVNCAEGIGVEPHIPNMDTPTAEQDVVCTVCGFVIQPRLDPDHVIAEGLWDGGPVRWKITADGTLTITGNKHIQGKMEYIWKDYSRFVTRIVISDGITKIPHNAFSQMENVTSVYIGNKVTSIAEDAFAQLPGLKEITFPASLVSIEKSAFGYCPNLEKVTFAEDGKLEYIGAYAFTETGVKEIVTPASLKTLDEYAFYNCTNLEYVHLAEGLETIVHYAFAGCTALKHICIPATVTDIRGGILDDCMALQDVEYYCGTNIFGLAGRRQLKSLIYGGEATIVGSFENCTALTEVTLGNKIEVIGDYAFAGCSALPELEIPDSVVRIDSHAFAYTDSLTRLVIPASVAEIDFFAFRESGIQEITFLGDAPDINSQSFTGTTLTAYYPADNATWTADKLQNYGGTITWVPIGGAHEHNYFDKVVAPKCTEDGYTVHTCACGYSYRDTVVPATGHSMLNWYVHTKPTCQSEGEERSNCENCAYYESHTLPVGEHNYITDTTPATCTKPGVIRTLCEYCGDVKSETVLNPTGIHIYSDGTDLSCDSCGDIRKAVDEEEMIFRFNDAEWAMLMLTNAARAEEGLEPLTAFSELQEVARVRADEIFIHFGSERPGGGNYNDLLTQLGITRCSSAESICMFRPDNFVYGWVDYFYDFVISDGYTHIGSGNRDNSWVSILVDCGFGVTCADYSDLRILVPDGLAVTPDMSVTEMGLVAVVTCDVHGDCYLPVLDAYCPNYNYDASSFDITIFGMTVTMGFGGEECTHDYRHENCTVSEICSVCGAVREAREHEFGDWNVATPASCTQNGEEARQCSNCAVQEVREIPASGHRGGMATCVRGALCEVCGEAYGDKDPQNHLGGKEIFNQVDAEEFKDGYTGDVYCADCDKLLEKGTVIPATHTHSFAGAWSADAANHWHVCSCGEKSDLAAHEPGSQATCNASAVCGICGTSYGVKNPANHTGETEIRNRVEASEFTDGYSGDVHCKGCGEQLEKGTVIPATHTHNFAGEWSADAANHWHICSCGEKSDLAAHVPGAEPTETSPQVCTVCGWELKPAIVHTHNPQKVDAKEATHTESGNKEYYICSCGNWYEDAEGTKLIEKHSSVLLLKFELGDVDHNHKLTSMDAMLLMQYKAGLLEETVSFCTECANVDGKMGVNSIDAMLILQYRAGLITSFR